jgi:hypothetical protein
MMATFPLLPSLILYNILRGSLYLLSFLKASIRIQLALSPKKPALCYSNFGVRSKVHKSKTGLEGVKCELSATFAFMLMF